MGLSPRVRGNRRSPSPSPPHLWSIPACAGEPFMFSLFARGEGVYPRVCGGTSPSICLYPLLMGLSPRVRGNPGLLSVSAQPAGSIPACAGEPSGQTVMTDGKEVYPRVCGGTLKRGQEDYSLGGLSPRVRGNPVCASASAFSERSIPACAGEPLPPACPSRRTTVYPRVCGGTRHSRICSFVRMGLSPRVRGNHG